MALRLDHAGIVVPDLLEAIAWYTRALGAWVAWREEPTDVPPDGVALPDEPHVRLCGAVLVVGPDTFLELHQYITPTGANGTRRRTCDTGLGHMAYFADDIMMEWRRLAGLGVIWYGEPYQITAGGLAHHWTVYGHDPFGVVIQLCWHPPAGPPPKPSDSAAP